MLVFTAVLFFNSSGAAVGYKDGTDRNCLHFVLRYGKGNADIVKRAIVEKQKKSPQTAAKTFVNVKDRKGGWNWRRSDTLQVLSSLMQRIV